MAVIAPVSTNVIHIKCLESQLNQIPVTNGYVIWCRDTGNVYFDFDDSRKCINEDKFQDMISELYKKGTLVGYAVNVFEENNLHGNTVLAQGYGEIFNDYTDRSYESDGISAKTGNTATGYYSHAEGHLTDAEGRFSHAEGLGTVASSESQHVSGMYNERNDNCLVIVGNGADENNRQNALELDYNGNLKSSGNIEDGNGNTLSELKEKIDGMDSDLNYYVYR